MPGPSPYAEYSSSELSLRDLLAVERTVVAHERTFLGYLRTALALFVTGASLLKFFDDDWLAVIGWGLIGACVPLVVFGSASYRRRRRNLRPLVARVDPS